MRLPVSRPVPSLLRRRPACETLAWGVAAIALLLGSALPAQAHPGGWGRDRWDGGSAWDMGPGAGRYDSRRDQSRAGPPEGQVNVSRFTTEEPEASLLRTGAITVNGAPTGSGVESRELQVYAAAVSDALAQTGYRIDTPEASAGQVAELHIAHDVVAPQEVKKPVSGEMAVGVSNRGTAYGLALNVDLSKPRAALIATTLEARIRDKASGKVLWEGRADINTREGDDKWTEGAIAAKLAAALFDRFPGMSGGN